MADVQPVSMMLAARQAEAQAAEEVVPQDPSGPMRFGAQDVAAEEVPQTPEAIQGTGPDVTTEAPADAAEAPIGG